ncbi:DUF368 domain-containing protein [Tepiditoga spiralis]|uniref:DUF368 domain-containing protein n=1 Tax=Tepiditoga spiralis TaxID=2108365 RepID=A0A7G1G4L9_9BACT|nr:DUF368 domain-containing protein [Tepiditoga spiralis]BBE31055.1 DUF368 domain-containing protein [Tepiditoga spiralis]
MFQDFFLGFLIGLANLVPGISGGTIAVISGKYEQLLTSVSDFISFKFNKKMLMFLLMLFLGAGVSVIGFSKVITYLFSNFEIYLVGTFVGLIFGGIVYLFKKINLKSKTNLLTIISSIIIFLIIFFMLPSTKANGNLNFFYLIFAGIIGAATMVLPGISGSSMLLIMGVYEPFIKAISEFDMTIILPVGIGVIIGLIFIVKLLDFLLKKNEQVVMSFLIGLTIAGTVKIFPHLNFLVIVFIFVGFYLGYIMEKIFQK